MMSFSFRSMLLAACAASIATALPGQAREFRSAEVHPADYPTTKAVEYMGQLLKERSGGKHSIKVFPNAALGQERDAIEQLKLGGLDMMRINVAPLNNVVPETIVPALPFLFRSEDQMHQVLDGPVGEKILQAMEKQGMVGLAFYDSGARSLYTTKPVKTLADVKGMKIRVQQSDVFVAMVQALGASATPMPYGEVYTALTTGLIDAAENNYPSYESSRHFEVAKYYNLTEHSMAPEVLVFSKRIWDRLSAEEQAMIRQAAKDSVPHMRQLWREREAKSKDVVLKAGVQLVQIEDKEKWAEAMKPLFEKFAATPELKSLVQEIQAAK